MSFCFTEQKQFWSRFAPPPWSSATPKSEECVLQLSPLFKKYIFSFTQVRGFATQKNHSRTRFDNKRSPPPHCWVILSFKSIEFRVDYSLMYHSSNFCLAAFVREPLLKAIVQLEGFASPPGTIPKRKGMHSSCQLSQGCASSSVTHQGTA